MGFLRRSRHSVSGRDTTAGAPPPAGDAARPRASRRETLLIGVPLLCLAAFVVVWLLTGLVASDGAVRWRAGLGAAVLVAVLGVRGGLRIPREPAASAAGTVPGAPVPRRGWRVLSNRYAPDRGLGLEDVVIGPGGAFHVSAVRWDGRSRVKATRDGRLLFGREEITGHLRLPGQQAEAVASALGAATGAPCLVLPVLAVGGRAAPRRPLELAGVTLVPAARLRRWLAAQRPVLSADEAGALAEAATEALPHNPLA